MRAGPADLSPREHRSRAAAVRAGNCSPPASATRSAGSTPATSPALNPSAPGPRSYGWRQGHELTSETTSPVMTRASSARHSGGNRSPVPLPSGRSRSRRLQSGSGVRAFAPSRSGGLALDDLHQSGGDFLVRPRPHAVLPITERLRPAC